MFARFKIMNNKSFTLVELLVSIAIFSIIITILGNIFVSASKTQTINLEVNELLSQSNYLMEYVSRALRMAKKDLGGECISPKLNYKKTNSRILEGRIYLGPGIVFMNYEGRCQEIFLDEETSQLMESKDKSFPLSLTSNKFEVTSFNIGPEESWSQDDLKQPRVTFSFQIKTKDNLGNQEFKMQFQTTLSQRNLDIKE